MMQTNMKFKTRDVEKFNDHVYYLVTKGVTFNASTSGDQYIIEYTGGF